eukprot:6462825-Amphidinium_carterae.1
MSNGSGLQQAHTHLHQLCSTHLATFPQVNAEHCGQPVGFHGRHPTTPQLHNRATSHTNHNPVHTEQAPSNYTDSGRSHNFTDTINIITYNSRTLNDVAPSTYIKVADRKKDSHATSSINANIGGQLQLLQTRLLSTNVDVACLQETRSTMNTCELKHYHFVHNPAVSGHGGVAVFVRRCPHITLTRHETFGKRILLVMVKIYHRPVAILSAHAPPQTAHASCHAGFNKHMQLALAASRPCNTVVGADLNMHLQPLREFIDTSLTGPYCSDDTLAKQRHSLPLIRTLAEAGMHFMNSILQPPGGDTIHTWRHPRFRHQPAVQVEGPQSQLKLAGHQQIDFILVSSALTNGVAFCRPLPWAHFDGLNGSDHRAVHINLLWQADSQERRQSRSRRTYGMAPPRVRVPTDDQHLLRYRTNIGAAVEESQWWLQDPADA